MIMLLCEIQSWGFLGKRQGLENVLGLAVTSKEDSCLMSGLQDGGVGGSVGEK